MRKDEVPAKTAELSRAQIVAALLALLFAILLGVVTPVCLQTWRARAPTATIGIAEVGTFVSAEANPGGFLSPTLTTVRTTEGSVTVVGAFSALRGSVLMVEELNKSGLNLCVARAPDSCVPLAGAWAGELRATPDTSRVFDFYGHGLTSDALGAWLGLGICISLGGLAVLSLSVVEGEQRNQQKARSAE